MTRRKQGLGLLGLLAVAALGVLAFAATAQAITLPVFLINKKLALHATATGTQEGPGILLVEKSNLALKCEKFTVQQGLILTYEDADATLLYEECKAFEFKNLANELPCHVSDVAGGKADKLHVTATALLLPIEFTSGDFGVLAENLKVQINFLSGTGCPLPLKNVITGSVCALIEGATNDTAVPLILLSEAIQKSAGCAQKLLFGANEGFIDGAATLKLTGAHEGLALGVSLDTVP